MAMMFAAIATQRAPLLKIDWIITFGQPQCGNEEFAKWFDSLGFSYLRFTNDPDLVPNLPPSEGKNHWCHAGEIQMLGLSKGQQATRAIVKFGLLIYAAAIFGINYFSKNPDIKANAKNNFLINISKFHHGIEFYLALVAQWKQ